MPVDKRTASAVGSLVGLAALALVWWVLPLVLSLGGDDPSPTVSTSSPASATDSSRTIDPSSGLPVVPVSDLPDQARDTLRLIDDGGPFPYEQDGEVFGNYEGLLPDEPRGYYHAYTVITPGEDDRGARRIITGTGGDDYWTADHYASFSVIVDR